MADAMGAKALHVGTAADYAPALRNALDARVPTVIDVNVSLDVKGYRSVCYPYPADFYQPRQPGDSTAALLWLGGLAVTTHAVFQLAPNAVQSA